MKKLFFAALLATVAVGGAFATDYYPAGSDSATIHCVAGPAFCGAKYSTQFAWLVPDEQQTTSNRVDISELPATQP